MDHGASVEFACNAINTGAIVTVTILAEKSFLVRMSGKILFLEKGILKESNSILAEEENGKYWIGVKITDWFKVKKCFQDRAYSADNIYSFRYYPFLSSIFKGNLYIDGTYINSILFKMPIKFKAIWHDISIYNQFKTKPIISHNQGDSEIIYIFRWDSKKNESKIYQNRHIFFDIPIRLGGTIFLKITEYPIYYLMISLSAISLSSYLGNIKIMFASLLAVVTFMVKQWGNSDVPQSGTFLTRAYIIAGIMLIIWTLSWHFNKVLGFCLIPPFLFLIYQSLKIIKDFKYSGRLPKLIIRYWCNEIKKRRTYQMNKSRFNKRSKL